MCTTLSILAFFAFGLLVLIMILVKSKTLENRTIYDAAIIGISIGMGVLLLIVIYFFVSEVLVGSSYKVKLLRRQEMKRKSSKIRQISVVNCE
jgi:uncharacterized membrane protein